jgi:UDP-N-acetylglucosamine:LPS N-acetylglucosamine transferase
MSERSERTERAQRPGHKVLLVCSSGGHLAQLHRLDGWWRDQERTWVTFSGADAERLLADEAVYWAYHPTTRNLLNLVRNTWLAWRLLRRLRPEVVVSNGAGVAVAFFVIARMLGIRTVFVEVYDRIDSSTLTGRLCAPLSDLFLVQWPEQQLLYPRSTVLGRLL